MSAAVLHHHAHLARALPYMSLARASSTSSLGIARAFSLGQPSLAAARVREGYVGTVPFPGLGARRGLATSAGWSLKVSPSLFRQPPHNVSSSRSLNTLTAQTVSDTRKSSYLYFDSLFPIKYGYLDFRSVWARIDQEGLLERIRNLLPTEEEGAQHALKIDKVIAREKDGGAFVKFSYHALGQEVDKPVAEGKSEEEAGSTKADMAAVDIEQLVRERISKTSANYKPWWIWGDGRFFLVQGKPWLEDMDRFPSNVIRIEFEGPDVPQEQLYDVLRPFGRVRDIYPQPASNKDTPRFAEVTFRSTRSAAAARNCLHGFKYGVKEDGTGGTTFRILYKERVKAHAFRDWMTAHPRITMPLIVALLGTMSWLIFDPIRQFMVKSEIEGTFDLRRYRSVEWLKRETIDRLGLGASKKVPVGTTGIEQERELAKETLQKWLRDLPEQFITLTGPRGAGKSAVVKEVIKDTRKHQAHILYIDCEAICRNAKGNDDKLVSELASQLGYFPQFAFLSSVNNLIDLASVGLIGQKAGFSSPVDVQLKNILSVAANAFKQIADKAKLAQRNKLQAAEQRHAPKEVKENLKEQLERDGEVHDGRVDCVSGNGAMSEVGLGLERSKEGEQFILGPSDARRIRSLARTETREDEESEMERLPVVILKGYAAKDGRGKDLLWDSLGEWAATLVENRVAHVVFISDNAQISKPLSKALPGKPLNVITVNDASASNAVDYVAAKLKELRSAEVTDTEVDLSRSAAANRASIAKLGGRQTDLEVLVQKLVAGQKLDEAVGDIVARSASELKKNVFADGDGEEVAKLAWSADQAWYLVKRLATSDEIPYADALFNGPFKGNDKALHALEQAEMISVSHSEHGKASVLRPGRPVYRYACEALVKDKVFAATQDLAINAAATTSATNDLKAAEQELIQLAAMFDRRGNFVFGGSPTVPLAIAQRTDALLAKMRASEEAIEKLGTEAAELKKVLKSA